MAKRQSPADPPSPQNSDPFDADIEDLNLDDLNVDDMRVDEVPHTDIDVDVMLNERSPARAPLGAGQIIGGAVQVIFTAVLIFVVLVALAGGVVLAGQRFGVIPARGSGGTSATAIDQPTMPDSAAIDQPTATPPPTATPRPEVAENPACPQAVAWWNSQQVQSNYAYFTRQVKDLARNSNNVAALTEQMRIHRDFVANFAADSCIDSAKAALLKAFDATIAVARAVNAHDDAQLAQQQPLEDQAYQELDTALQAVGVDITAPAASG
jgi:hypothetical protein